MEEEPAHVCKDESMAEVILVGDRKKMSEGNGDTLRRDALKRGDCAVCGRVISCSRGQERWRTELELCGCESFDDGHRSAALGTAPQRVRGRSGRGFRRRGLKAPASVRCRNCTTGFPVRSCTKTPAPLKSTFVSKLVSQQLFKNSGSKLAVQRRYNLNLLLSVLIGSLQGIAERPLPCSYNVIQQDTALSRRRRVFQIPPGMPNEYLALCLTRGPEIVRSQFGRHLADVRAASLTLDD